MSQHISNYPNLHDMAAPGSPQGDRGAPNMYDMVIELGVTTGKHENQLVSLWRTVGYLERIFQKTVPKQKLEKAIEEIQAEDEERAKAQQGNSAEVDALKKQLTEMDSALRSLYDDIPKIVADGIRGYIDLERKQKAREPEAQPVTDRYGEEVDTGQAVDPEDQDA